MPLNNASKRRADGKGRSKTDLNPARLVSFDA